MGGFETEAWLETDPSVFSIDPHVICSSLAYTKTPKIYLASRVLGLKESIAFTRWIGKSLFALSKLRLFGNFTKAIFFSLELISFHLF